MKKRLFLIDAYAMIYRAYFAFIRAPRIDSKGRNTSTIFGFAMMLEDVIDKERPDYIAVVFDPPGGSFRKEMFVEYKANRKETPEDIRFSIPYIKELVKIYNIPIIECPRYEADDVIATLALQAEAKGLQTYMVTADKDFSQIVSDDIFLYRPNTKGSGYSILGVKEVCEKFDLDTPRQMIDYLSLVGDTADNIPGVSGIGPKIASKLLKEYGDVENIIAHIPDMKGKLQENLANGVDQLRLSYQLATMETTAPVALDEKNLVLSNLDIDSLKEFFSGFDIKTLLNRILENNSKRFPLENAKYKPEVEVAEKNHILTEFNLDNLTVKYLSNSAICDELKVVAFQSKKIKIGLLGHSNNVFSSQIQSLALSVDGIVFYVFNRADSDTHDSLGVIKKIMEDKDIVKVGYDLKRIKHVMNNQGVQVCGPLFDVMLAHYILNSDLSHDMHNIAKMAFGYTVLDIKDVLLPYKINDYEISLLEIDSVRFVNYSLQESFLCCGLYEKFAQEIEATNLNEVFYGIEMPLIDVLYDMEVVGSRLDVDELKRQETELLAELASIEKNIYMMAGCEFNINSPQQVGNILFAKMAIVNNASKTRTGQYKTSEEQLEKIVHKHPIVGAILEYRSLRKLISTYLSPLPSLLHSDGRLHATFNQAIASTGRLSSSDPNIQNIPIRTDNGKRIRSAFVPSEGNVFLSADYSQIELRLMAELSGDPDLMDAFLNDQDIHNATAAKLYNVPVEFVTPEQRRNAKTANFGIIYGISTFGLTGRLGISFGEAKKLINEYFTTYPTVKKYMDRVVENARENGYVETITHRRRYLADINSRNAVVRGYAERNAINAPLQGSAADIIKKAMVDIYHEFQRRGLKSKMIIQVHDELNFDVFPVELEEVKSIVLEKMQGVFPSLSVPLSVSIGVGESWLQAH